MSEPLAVQFVHGLESGPKGTKVRHLNACGFEVLAQDMEMSLQRLDRANSVARNLMRLSEVHWTAGLGALGLCVAGLRQSGGLLLGTMGAVGGVVAWRHRAWLAQAFERSFERCVAVQADALLSFGPDVLVGSSWGGAVSLELVRRGLWRGPMVLLAPAYGLVGRYAGWADQLAREAQIRARLSSATTIFHDPSDSVVPCEESLRLFGDEDRRLRMVSAGGHRLLGVLEDGSLERAIRDVAAV